MFNLFRHLERTDDMTISRTFGLALLLASLSAVGCADKGTPSSNEKDTKVAPKDDDKKKGGHPDHGAGPNGGVIFDLGKYHAEFTVNHPKKECYILIIAGEDEKAKPLPIAAKEFTLTTKETKVKEGADKGKIVAPMTITMKAVDAAGGKAAKFMGTDPGLGNVADFEGAVTGEIDEKPSSGEFKE
jgi:hypothetical protein